MDRYFKMFFLIVTIVISISFNSSLLQATNSKKEKQIITKKQAAEHAAKLANEKCQKDFGLSPFTPESFQHSDFQRISGLGPFDINRARQNMHARSFGAFHLVVDRNGVRQHVTRVNAVRSEKLDGVPVGRQSLM